MPQRAFSLIEIIIYLAILGLVVVGFGTYVLSISSSRQKTDVVVKVQANARISLDTIAQKIRAARSINIGSSVFNTDPGVLSLAMSDASKNPTIINLDRDNGILQVQEGAGSPAAVTSKEVAITNLVFTNIATPGVRSNIRIQITVEYPGSSGYSQSLESNVSLRQ
ncbi:MAG: prepilin-type N-terminal cleavage/methylation domain-containing protein [Candidatus Ryanbacteria bacterium]|nr:prepilin-type N-terminal cleavage/methylation domain-containing protein [Candidatus Ryanbacteria bacterium]